MATSPHAEQILDGIVDELETIIAGGSAGSGYVYNYTPKKVYRVPTFEGTTDLLNANGDGPFYFVRDDGELSEDDEVTTFGEQGYAMLVPVFVAHRDNRNQRDPNLSGYTSTGTVQNRMVGDVIAALTSDEKRGATAIFETEFQRADRDFHDVQKVWICALLFFNVKFVRPLGNP